MIQTVSFCPVFPFIGKLNARIFLVFQRLIRRETNFFFDEKFIFVPLR